MKKKFTAPELSIAAFDVEDIICASYGTIDETNTTVEENKDSAEQPIGDTRNLA